MKFSNITRNKVNRDDEEINIENEAKFTFNSKKFQKSNYKDDQKEEFDFDHFEEFNKNSSKNWKKNNTKSPKYRLTNFSGF